MLFAAIYVPDFPAAAIERHQPELRERSLAVLEGKPPLERVFAMNEKARTAGVECGMGRVQAETLAGLALRPRSPAQEAAATAALLDGAHAFSPRVEATAPDLVIADIAGLERLFGAPQKIARDLARRVAEIGLEANVGVASNPDAAMHAARGFPGVTVIPAGEEAERLGGLPLDVLALPVEMLETLDRWGVRTFRALAALPDVSVAERLGQEGVRWQQLARGATGRTLVPAEPALTFAETMELEYPVELLDPLAFVLARMLDSLCARLGSRALATNELRLRLELGNEVSSFEFQVSSENPPRRRGGAERNQISHRGTEGTEDTEEVSSFEFQVSSTNLPRRRGDTGKVSSFKFQVSSEAAAKAAPSGSGSDAGSLRDSGLKARPTEARSSTDFRECSSNLLPHSSSDSAPSANDKAGPLETRNSKLETSFSRTLRFPVPMNDSKTFLRLLRLDLQAHPPPAPVVAVELAAEPVKPRSAQAGLFVPRAPEPEKLELTLARVAGVVGEDRVGTPEVLDTHRPDAFGMRRFAPWGTEKRREQRPAAARPREALVALRRFRPPLRVRVDVRDGRPARVLSPTSREVRGHVIALAGPWRTSGEWWTEEKWMRDEWDVMLSPHPAKPQALTRATEGTAVYRIYRDLKSGEWFVDGSYD